MFKVGDKVKRKNSHVIKDSYNSVYAGCVVTVESVTKNGFFSVKEECGSYNEDYFVLVEQPSETVGFETKVLQALAIGVLSNDQQMLAELVIKRDILQKEIERLNQQIYAKQSDVNRLTKFIA